MLVVLCNRHRLALLGLAASLVGAASPATGQDRVITGEPETIITMASGLIGSVNDMLVATDGRVYVADAQANVIHVVGSDGEMARTIGRAGQGPGEFNRPTNLSQKGDTLRVVDWQNGRLQMLSMNGEPVSTVRLERTPWPPVFGPTGLVVNPTVGFAGDTTLAVIRSADFTERARIGRTMGTSPNPVNMAAMREQIRDGEVPPIMLNTAEVDLDASGSVWLTVAARASVEQFDDSGRRRWALQVDDPDFEDLRRRFFTENAAAEPMQMFALRYFLNAQVVGTDLWLLLGQSERSAAVIRVVRSNGSLGERMEFANVSGVDRFAVDTERRLVYFVSPETAELLRIAY
jgi:hypothetical protein